jgi:hypothetical protein
LNLRTAVAALAALAGVGLSWPALAQWVDLGEDSSFRYAVDPASLRGDRTRRTVLALFNARTPGQRVQSMRVVLEADCLDARVRIVSRTLHASPMGVGSELSLPIAASSAWDYVRPGSANEVLRRWACDAGDPSAAGAVAGAPAAGQPWPWFRRPKRRRPERRRARQAREVISREGTATRLPDR